MLLLWLNQQSYTITISLFCLSLPSQANCTPHSGCVFNRNLCVSPLHFHITCLVLSRVFLFITFIPFFLRLNTPRTNSCCGFGSIHSNILVVSLSIYNNSNRKSGRFATLNTRKIKLEGGEKERER